MIQAPFCLSINFFYLLSLCPISSFINMSISLSICVHFDLTLCLFLYIFHLFCFYLFFIRVFKFLFLHLLCFFYFIYLRVRVHCYPEQLDIKNQFFIAWKAIFIFAIFIFMARRFVWEFSPFRAFFLHLQSILCSRRQCDQMAILLFKYLAIQNNQNFPNSMTLLAK